MDDLALLDLQQTEANAAVHMQRFARGYSARRKMPAMGWKRPPLQASRPSLLRRWKRLPSLTKHPALPFYVGAC